VDDALEPEASTVTLHLNPWASNASDSNDGSSSSRPLKTIQAAFEKMIPIKESGSSVRILFYPGVYRDTLIGTESRPHWRIPDNSAWLILAAQEKGKAIFSGSDVWTGWTNEGSGLWSKAWPYDWGAPGAGNDPFPGALIFQNLQRGENSCLWAVNGWSRIEMTVNNFIFVNCKCTRR
jgi:hypothetical protein